jgi:hypothetical protein
MMTTLHLAAVFFGLAALGGLTLAVLRVRGGNPPLGLAALHGLAAATGLVTLAVGVLGLHRGGAAMASLILFAVAALGGFVLIATHLRGKVIPLGLVLGHGTLAVAGFVALLVYLFS